MIATTVQGTGPSILWIHGYTMDSTTWRPLWDLLPGWRHIGVDLPGHGGSAPIPHGLTLPALAEQIAQLGRAEQATRVVALSFGSLIAVQLAIDHPDAVSQLVLAAPTLAGVRPDPAAKGRSLELLTLRRLVGAGAPLVDLWMQSPPEIFQGTERHPQLRADLRAVIARHPWTELEDGSMQTLTDHTHTAAELASITARTLVIIGEQDMPAFVDNAELLCSVVPDCRLLRVPDAGHLPVLERPCAVAAPIAQHLTQPSPNGALT